MFIETAVLGVCVVRLTFITGALFSHSVRKNKPHFSLLECITI